MKLLLLAYRLLIAVARRGRLLGRNRPLRVERRDHVGFNERVLTRTRRYRRNAIAQHRRRCQRRVHDFSLSRGIGGDCRLKNALDPLARNLFADGLSKVFGISTDWSAGRDRSGDDPVCQIGSCSDRSSYEHACCMRIRTHNDGIERGEKSLSRRCLDCSP
jgi:hypothetical protein